MVEAAEVPQDISDVLAGGATVLTGNQRAARLLRQAVDRQNRSRGLLSWSPPPILAWSTWTASLWRQLLLTGATNQMLLNRAQEHALWRTVISEDDTLSTLKSPESLAQMAAEAWAVLARHRGLRRLKGSATNTDTEAFIRWSAAFDERCRAGRYLPDPRLEGTLRKAILAGTLKLPATSSLFLLGFDRILPDQAAMIEALRQTGTHITIATVQQPPTRRILATAPDEDSELAAAATWARAWLTRDPNARLAILSPGIPQLRPHIDRVFREILAPESQSITASQEALPYEFSAGSPLSESPMVSTALDLLSWATTSLPREKVSDLLLSPYLASASGVAARAEFDAFELRPARLLRPEITLRWLIGKLKDSPRANLLSPLQSSLTNMQAIASQKLSPSQRRTYGEWSETIRQILAAAAWADRPGEDSVEFQTREKWEGALDILSTLDFEGKQVSYNQATDALRRVAHETIFAPESREAPIQILGPEESNGQQFDAIWFLRAGDLTWPAPTIGSPLLGWPLRRELGIPGSNQAADTAQARHVTQRIATCATEEIVFSYARESSTGRQRPSPALAGLDLERTEAVAASPPAPLVALEANEDATPITPLPDSPIEGGAAILKAQAACAFHAFAARRLFATDLEERTPGMDARERGTAVHVVLERFWEEVKTQAALKAMTSEARHTLLATCINHALRRASAEEPSRWDTAYLETQRSRLHFLCNDWLDLELTRAPFTVVSREAETRNASIGPLRLTLRLDRIDQVENGAVLIDYKTGDASPSAWLSDRPDEPQLPLYAVLADEFHLDAVAFGRLRPGKDMALTGYEDTPRNLTKPTKLKLESLEAQREDWYRVLTDLANGFATGDTRVSPKQYPNTCEFCAHRLICRLDVSTLDPDDEEAEPRADHDQ